MRKNNIITLIGSALVVCCYSSCCNKMNQDDALAYGQLMANEIKNIQSSDNAMTRATRMSQTRRKIMKFMDDNHICHPDNVTIGSEAYYEAITNMAYDLLEKRNDVSFSH